MGSAESHHHAGASFEDPWIGPQSPQSPQDRSNPESYGRDSFGRTSSYTWEPARRGSLQFGFRSVHNLFERSKSTPMPSFAAIPCAVAVAVPITHDAAERLVHAEARQVSWGLTSWIDGLEMPSREIMEVLLAESATRRPAEELLRVKAPETECYTSEEGSCNEFTPYALSPLMAPEGSGGLRAEPLDKCKVHESLSCHTDDVVAASQLLETKCFLG